MAVVAGVGGETMLPAHEDDSIASREKVLSRGGTSSSGRKVVEEADDILLERHRGSAAGDENDLAPFLEVALDKLARRSCDLLEIGRWLLRLEEPLRRPLG